MMIHSIPCPFASVLNPNSEFRIPKWRQDQPDTRRECVRRANCGCFPDRAGSVRACEAVSTLLARQPELIAVARPAGALDRGPDRALRFGSQSPLRVLPRSG